VKSYEVNFDGIVGPSHHYGGFSYGNLASMQNKTKPSNPKLAALQGLEKMRLLSSLGIKQAVLPPHERPDIHFLRSLGFCGNDHEIIATVLKQSKDLYYQCCTSSSMWTANAATICPSADSSDKRLHITPANLSSMLHRSLEAPMTERIFAAIFEGTSLFALHPPLPAGPFFSDEGAANHTRFCKSHASAGIHFFVFGRRSLGPQTPQKFPARQSLEASQAVARLHLIPEESLVFAQQSPNAIDAGAFHNDVVSVGNENLFLFHEDAFVDGDQVIAKLQNTCFKQCGTELICIQIGREELSLKDSVSSYFFNSQIVTLPDGTMTIIAPIECEENSSAKAIFQRILNDKTNPIRSIHYVDLRQSMQNGGGPACLRLRIALTEKELHHTNPHVFLTDPLYVQLKSWIERHYRDTISHKDLEDPLFLDESHRALDELTQLLDLGAIYPFQRGLSYV
jgi:succinylarginine dihydrolase